MDRRSTPQPQLAAPWHEEFFSGAWQRVQPHSFSAEETRLTAETLRELLQLPPTGRVLDVPCGDGRIAEHFARWGYTVCGIDRSEHFLGLARKRAKEQKLEVDYRAGDMWKGEFGEDCYEAALSMWSSIGYAGEEEDRDYFRKLFAALSENGTLVLDTQCLETVLADFQDRQWYRAGEILVAEERRFDPVSARVLSTWTFAGDGVYEERASALRIYSYRELETMLAEIGFGEFESYGGLQLEEFSVESPRLLLVAHKRD